jgi:hypothetical protein
MSGSGGMVMVLGVWSSSFVMEMRAAEMKDERWKMEVDCSYLMGVNEDKEGERGGGNRKEGGKLHTPTLI